MSRIYQGKVTDVEIYAPPGTRQHSKGPADVLDHATSEVAIGSKPGIDATKNPPAKASNAPGHR